MLQQAIGGPEGEMRVMNQYLFQAWGARGDKKYRDMLLHTGTKEIGHIEVLATAVAMNLDGMPSEKIDDAVTNPLVAARMGGVEPRHYLSGGLAAMPSDANGAPFNAACIDVAGNLSKSSARATRRRRRTCSTKASTSSTPTASSGMPTRRWTRAHAGSRAPRWTARPSSASPTPRRTWARSRSSLRRPPACTPASTRRA